LGFLLCENCGGYYELQTGESPEEFENCQCGGKLEYVPRIDSEAEEEFDPDYEHIQARKDEFTDGLAIYKDIAQADKHSYLEMRDKNLDDVVSNNLLTNSGFILLTFAIFPLKYGVIFQSLAFILMALFALVLAGVFFYFQTTKQISTLHKMQRIYSIVGIYFITFLALFFIWALMWAMRDMVQFLSYYINVMGPADVLIIGFALLFTQKFLENSTSYDITDPLTAMGKTTKFVYYVVVFINVATFLFAIFAGFYLTYAH